MRSLVTVRIALAAISLGPSCLLAQESKPEEIIVTSSALRESLLEVAQPTAVVSGDDLRRQIAASIGETLSTQLGVSSSYFGPSASRPIIRGLGGDRVQVLQDGLAALDVSNLSQDHAVTLESIVSQQIEIIKGPAALLYGSGAAGGLVNVVSNRIPMRSAARPLSGAAELRGATATGERTGAVSLDGGGERLMFHADYFKRETDEVRIPGFVQSRPLRQALIEAGEEPDGVRGRIGNSASEASGGALGASVIGDAARGGFSWSRHDMSYGIPGEESAYIDMQQDRYSAKAEVDLPGALSLLRFDGAYNDYTHMEFEGPGEPGTLFNQAAYELRLSADHALGRGWRGTLGAQYVDVDFEAIGEEAFVPASKTRTLSLFAFEERHFERWTIELGARAERQRIDAAARPDYDATALSASLGTIWTWSDDHAVALNLTRTQRNPQAAELYADGPHLAAQRYEIGNADLSRETAVTADLSLRRTGDGVQWTLNAYYNDYSDYIYANPSGSVMAGLPVFAYVQRGAKLRGFEAELVLPLLQQGQRQLHWRLASDYVRGKIDGGGDLPQMPALRFGSGLHYEVDAWHLGLEAFYYARQNRVEIDELPTAGFTRVDADASYRLPLSTDGRDSSSLFLFVRGTNLLDEDARQHASPLKDIAPLPGRSLVLGVRAEF